MQRVALAVCTIAVIVGLAGLGAVAVSTRQPVPVPVAVPEPSGTAARPAPLTGVPVADPKVLARPVAAVKIDNAAGAHPQAGLDRADIVFEALAEGGLTRFVALFHSMDARAVGPVRSARDADANLLPAFSGLLGVSGAAPGVNARLRLAGLHVLSEGRAPPGAFFRTSERQPPHNLFARPQELWRAGANLPPAVAPWEFGPPPLGGRPAPAARAVFSPNASVEWIWDTGQRAWLRQEDGRAHLVSSGGQVAAENVVVATVVTAAGDGVDAGGEPTIAMEVIGEGPAVVLRDGRAYDVRWRKTSPSSQFEWVTRGGSPLPLAPGRTWIELIPSSGSLVVGPLP